MESVYLRSLELDDLDRIHKWHNDPALYESLAGTFWYASRIAEEEWLRKRIAYSTQEINLAICLTSNSQHIGNAYLHNIDWINRRAMTSLFIGDPEQQGKGYGTTVKRLLLKYAFEDLGLLRVYSFILADNKASIRMNEKCGLAVEGKLRKHFFKGGEFKDAVVMGICADDFSSTEV